MTRVSSEETRRRLLEELKKAGEEFNHITRESTKIIMDVPSGIPLPDGKVRIVQAAQKAKFAFQKYQEAVHGYCDFLKSSTEPQDQNQESGEEECKE